jgi:hypothetical protein
MSLCSVSVIVNSLQLRTRIIAITILIIVHLVSGGQWFTSVGLNTDTNHGE